MKIFIARGEAAEGPYALTEVRSRLLDGRLSQTDKMFRECDPLIQTIADFLAERRTRLAGLKRETKHIYLTESHKRRNEHMRKLAEARSKLPPRSVADAMAQYDRVRGQSMRK